MAPESESSRVDGSRVIDRVGENRLLLTAKEAAEMCGKKQRTWRSWDAAGYIPKPVRLGGSTLWRLEELKSWIEAGCPRRSEWENQR